MASPICHSWLLEDKAQLPVLLKALGNKFRVTQSGHCSHRITYLDTFDWRIWRKGDVLEYHEFDEQKKLIWRAIDQQKIHIEIPLDDCPAFINDIPDWLRPKPLMEITWPRVLVEQALSRSQQHTYNIQDRSGKVISRLHVINEKLRQDDNRSGESLATRLQIEVMRGYEKQFTSVMAIVEQAGLSVYGKDSLVRLLQLDDRRPCDYSSHLRLQLQPLERTDATARQIMLQLLQMMAINEQGIREDMDTEFLHDYRHAVQSMHSLLRQLKQVIPEDTRKRLDKDLVWVNKETSCLFELNTWLLDFEDHRRKINRKLRPHLDELLNWLRKQRHAALLKVVKLFESEAYKKFMKRWHIYLECEVPQHSVLKRAEKPALEMAGRQIWRVYQKLSGVDARLLKADLQAMDEATTTLADLLTLSRTLYADADVVALADSLQTFQKVLTDCAEKQKQVKALAGFIHAMKHEGLHEEKSGPAMEKLLGAIKKQQSVCLEDLQLAYMTITNDETRNTYQQLFKPVESSLEKS